ncbi:WEB family protein, partial [Trifolium medium]|nr:WEB family protein [Trifolium medium]
MWESIKIEKKEFSPEKVAAAEAEESFEEEVESKIDGGGEANGASVTENIDDGG